MSEQRQTFSDLIEISKLNRSFKRNYGTFIGAYGNDEGRVCVGRRGSPADLVFDAVPAIVPPPEEPLTEQGPEGGRAQPERQCQRGVAVSV